MPTFFVIRVILILDSHLLLVFQRTLHLWVCLLKPHLRKNEKKKKKKNPLLIRFTFQVTLMPDGLTNESPCTSFSVIQLSVIIQFDF